MTSRFMPHMAHIMEFILKIRDRLVIFLRAPIDINKTWNSQGRFKKYVCNIFFEQTR